MKRVKGTCFGTKPIKRFKKGDVIGFADNDDLWMVTAHMHDSEYKTTTLTGERTGLNGPHRINPGNGFIVDATICTKED